MSELELQELLDAAGVNVPDRRSIETEWARKQMTYTQPVPNQIPEPQLQDFQLTHQISSPVENLANRLNVLLGSDIKIDRLQ